LPRGFLENGGTVEEALAEFPELDKEDLEATRTWPANLGGTQVEYDRVADVLYVSLGDPVPAVAREDAEVEGLHLRYAMDDNHLCGATIVWYSTQDLPTLKAKVPFAVDWPKQVGEEDKEVPELTTEATRFKYDSRHDVLHAFYGPGWSGWSADTTEPAPGVFVRLDDQDRPVGATILDYSERDKADLGRLVPFKVDWPDMEDKE
jgi:uncharacterized protein YuzE